MTDIQTINVNDLLKAARLNERERVTAWLRKHGYRQLADAIEAKEHLNG